jgi:hypothetical protein
MSDRSVVRGGPLDLTRSCGIDISKADHNLNGTYGLFLAPTWSAPSLWRRPLDNAGATSASAMAVGCKLILEISSAWVFMPLMNRAPTLPGFPRVLRVVWVVRPNTTSTNPARSSRECWESSRVLGVVASIPRSCEKAREGGNI